MICTRLQLAACHDALLPPLVSYLVSFSRVHLLKGGGKRPGSGQCESKRDVLMALDLPRESTSGMTQKRASVARSVAVTFGER